MHPLPRNRTLGSLQARCVRAFAATSMGLLLGAAGSPKVLSADVLFPGYLRQEVYRDIPGLDALAVGVNWRLENEPAPPNFAPPIGGSHLATYADPDNASLQWDRHPAGLTVTEGEPARFQVRVTAAPGPVTYQWQRNGVDILDARYPDLSLAGTTLAEAGATYRCVVRIPGRTATSEAATLRVNPDTQPPRVESAEGGVARTSVTLRFSEHLDPADAADPALFAIDGNVEVTGARLLPDRRSIRLRTTPQTPGREYTVTLRGLRDAAAAANRMPEDSRIPFVAWEPEEEPGPFASWWDVKRDFGAVGDGTTDDTDAWQRALDSLGFSGNNPQPKAVLHVPAGTYRITRTLEFRSRFGAGVVGEDPETTILRWNGPDDGVLLWVDGTRNMRFARLTLDGRTHALSLIDQKLDSGQWPPNENEFSDLILKDAKNGIRGGTSQLDSEISVQRCRFLRCSEAGIRLESFNALDWWVWDCLFDTCGYGVTNPGGGAAHVYRSLFRHSTISDLANIQCDNLSYRDNTSVGSRAFLVQQCGAFVTLQRNTIVDPVEPTPIRMAGGSGLLLLDNVIRTLPEHDASPVVSGMGKVTAVGNLFNAPNPVAPGGSLFAHDNQVLPREHIAVDDHELPGFRVRRDRPVLHVPWPLIEGEGVPFATAVDIQRKIDEAAALRGQRPVVHLPYADIQIDRTLVIPANSDLQLVGDGYGTRLLWHAATNGTILRLDGPSRATVRGLSFHGECCSPDFAWAHAVEINDVDQPGSRLFAERITVGPANHQPALLFDRLRHLQPEFRAFNQGGAVDTTSVVAIGGPAPEEGSPPSPLIRFFGGASSDSASNYEVQRGARLVAQDFWYEGTVQGFLRLTNRGSLTLHGFTVAPSKADAFETVLPPAIDLEGFQGALTLLQVAFRRPIHDIQLHPPGTGVDFMMANSYWPFGELRPIPAGATTAWFQNRSTQGTEPFDAGSPDSAWIELMLRDTREAMPTRLSPTAAGASDVRLYDLTAHHILRGILVTGSNAPPTLAAVTNQTLAEDETLTAALSASDPDQPFQTLRFFLDSDAPFGASVDPQSGQFTWRTQEDQGPAEYVIPIHVADDGSPSRVATLPLRVTVTERNEAPRLGIPGQRLAPAALTSQDIGIPGDPKFPGSLTENTDGSLELTAGGSEARFGEDFIHFAHREITGDFDVRTRISEFDFFHGGARAGIMVRDQLDRRGAALFLAVNPDDPGDADEYTFYRRSAFAADTDFPGHRSRGVPHPNAWMRLVRGGDRFTAYRSIDGTEWLEIGRYDTGGSLPRTVLLGIWGVSLYNFTAEGRLRVRFESFEVRVPDVVPVPPQSLDEGAELRVDLAAVDPDLPAQALRFELGSGTPEGVVVDPSTGVLTWTPSEAQGPGAHVLTVKVTDDGSTPRSSEIDIPVGVAEVNRPPEMASALLVPVDEGQPFAWTPEVSDPDLPANPLAWTLVAGPPGMVLDPESHTVAWTPSESHGGQTFTIELRVDDTGSPPRSVERTFRLAVNEVNTAPSIVPIQDRAVDEGAALVISPTATDSDLPAQIVSWSLDPNASDGASVHAGTGVFAWTPTEAQGPGVYTFRLIATDDGNPPRQSALAFQVTVNEVNAAPVLEPIPPATATEGQTVEFLAHGSDARDIPPNPLSYAAENLPVGAQFDSVTGRFTWTPAADQVGEHTIRIVVRDTGSPPMSTEQPVRLRIEPGRPPRLESVERLGGQVRFRWSTRPGARYRVQVANSLLPADWQDLHDLVATGESAEYTESFEDASQHYFRIVRSP